MVVGAFARTLVGHMQMHSSLVPLFGALAAGATLSASCMLYTSLNKADVSWNRWYNPTPYDRVDPTRHQQKVFCPTVTEKSLYKHDYVVEDLRKEIYKNFNPSVKSHH